MTEERPLAIGETAPDLLNLDWIKGIPTNIGEKLTLVECWATWCGPCLQSIPHLTSIQTKYSNQLQLIGISQEEKETVAPFVENMGEQMGYRVAVAPDEVYNAYMEGIPGIPHSFLINANKELIWHCHPMELDSILDGYISGKITESSLKEVAIKKQEYDALISDLSSGQVEDPNPAVEKLVDVSANLLLLTPDNIEIFRTVLYMTVAIDRQDLLNTFCNSIDKANFSISTLSNYLDNGLLEYAVQSNAALTHSIDWLNHITKSEANSPYVLLLSARLLYAIGQLDKAIEKLEKATFLDPENANIKGLLSTYLFYKKSQDNIRF